MLNLLTNTKNWLLVTSFVATTAFAQQQMSKPQMKPIYNAPARIDVKNSWDTFVTGKILYWQAQEENLEIGAITRNDPEGISGNGDFPFTTSYVNKMNVINPHFTYRTGFKIGLGANMEYDNWTTLSEYTWFHSTISTGVQPLEGSTSTISIPNGEYLTPIQGAAGSMVFSTANESSDSDAFFFHDANQSWTLKMDFLDVSLARSYYSGTKLTVRPFFGARGAWVRQRLDTIMNGSTEYQVAALSNDNSNGYDRAVLHDSSTSWGVGPRSGFESSWLLGRGVRLIGNGSADILYTRYSLRTNEQLANQATSGYYNQGNNSPIDTNASISQKIDYLRSHAELELGFGWGSYFASDKWHFDMAATYGFQVFWDQNMFRNYTTHAMPAKSFAPNGDLFIHGATFSTSLDF
jgi:hypothetical protein